MGTASAVHRVTLKNGQTSAISISSISTNFLLHNGVLLSLLGLGYLWAFIVSRGSADDLGYRVGVGMGIVGVLVMVVAIIALPGLVMRKSEGPGTAQVPSQQQRIDDLDRDFGPAGLPKP